MSLLAHAAIDDPEQALLVAKFVHALSSSEDLGEHHLSHAKHAAPADIGSECRLLEFKIIAVGEPESGAVDESGHLVVVAVVTQHPNFIAVFVVEAQVDGMCHFEVLFLA